MPSSIWYCPICYIEGSDPAVTRCPEDGTPVELISRREARWVDQTIDGKYRVVRIIGTGGMADVFEVEKLSSGKKMALKLLKSAFTRDSHLNVRFRQEAMLISLIAHRNIVTMEDFGVLEDNTSYMVMELLSGYSLGEALKMGPLAPEIAFQIMLQTCEGMAAAHERGVLHRDLKPDNIFLHTPGDRNEPVVKILDLGIGKLFSNNTPSRGLTLSGTVVGTPEYMSPEQCKGQDAGVASDIYSAGIVLYEMLFGHAPFEDESPLLVLPRQISEAPSWNDGHARAMKVPADAKRIIMKALSKNPDERQESMLDFQRDISGLLSRVRRGVKYTLPSFESVKSAGRKMDTAEQVNVRAVTQVALSRTSVPPDPRAITLEFARNVFWVGQRHHTQLECNSYLRVFEGNGNRISILIDPGPLRDLDVIKKNISSVIGTVENLNYIYLNHQDPDVAGNAAELQRLNPAVLIICSDETWRLARHYGLDPRRYVSLESIPGQQIGLSTGHSVRFIPTPFCHARGANMIFDPENRVLFSGDLFGGTTARDGYVFAEEDLAGIELFHQIYMPCSRALKRALDSVRHLSPKVRMIAPQHGNLISREHVTTVVDALGSLRVGMDLIEYNENNHDMVALANEAVRAVSDISGKQAVKALISGMGKDQNLMSQFEIREPDQIIAFKTDSLRAMEFLFSHAEQLVSTPKKEQLSMSFKSIRERMKRLIP